MVRINRVYTKAGDAGKTSLIGGAKVDKSDARVDCYGNVDELNAAVGMALAFLEEHPAEEALRAILLRIQNELFNLGSQLATPDPQRRTQMPNISDSHVEALEAEMDQLNQSLPDLTSFVLPGGSKASAAFHMARTICRRAERAVIPLREEVELVHLRYLNRLSDALFVFGRFALLAEKKPEPLWQPESV